MVLLYRSILQGGDDDLGRSIGRLFVAWLASKGIEVGGVDLDTRQGAEVRDRSANLVLVQRRSVPLPARRGTPSARAERYRLVENTALGVWSTTITVFSPPPRQHLLFEERDDLTPEGLFEDKRSVESWAWVDLEFSPVEQDGEQVRPGSPRVVRDLMAVGDVHDAGVPLTAEPLRITAAHVSELVEHIRSGDRHVPVMVFASDAQQAYDRDRLAALLARDLAGVAAVFLLVDAVATEALAKALPDGFAVYGGALRTYLPGAGADGDEPSRHRILGRSSIAAMRSRAFPAVRDQVLLLSTQRAAPAESEAIRRGMADLSPATDERRRPPLGATVSPIVAWINILLHKVRSALGGDPINADVTTLSAAQEALEEEIEHLVAVRHSGTPPLRSDDSTGTEDLAALTRTLANLTDEREVYEALLSDADIQARVAHARAEDDQLTREYLELELAEVSRSEADLRRRLAYLVERERERGGRTVDDVDPIAAPGSVADALNLAREHLPAVVLGDVDEVAAELDVHNGSELYAARTWAALLALNDYATARSRSDFAGSFFHWCQQQSDGAWGLSAAAVAMGESESVNDNPELRAKRVFTVPREVDPDGRAYMAAHIKIVKRGTPCPRLHFFDDAGGVTGKVYVGYIGEHLPTARHR